MKRIQMKKIGFAAAIICCSLSACKQEPNLTGTWLEPIPGMEDQTQGFTLKGNGTAASMNMATLQYTAWTKEGDQLILNGNSIGNGGTFPFADTLTIKKLTEDSLVLQKGMLTRSFARAK